MRTLVALFVAVTALLAPVAHAQVLSVETYVEEWDDATQKWVRIEEGASRLAIPQPDFQPAAPQNTLVRPKANDGLNYGPFRVIDQDHAELVGTTNHASPADFAQMLADHPAIATLKMVEAPGTDDDRANLIVGRMIRKAGITTHVPAGGSVRSGAVELFLAGASRQVDDGAEFAVHSWMDINGRQPHDFAPDARENRLYLDYYVEMGMTQAQAQAFYDMTNSVAFDSAKWLSAQEMRRWIAREDVIIANDNEAANRTAQQPRIAFASAIGYLDSDALLP